MKRQFGLSYKNTLGILFLVLSVFFLAIPGFTFAAQIDSGLMSKAQGSDGVRIMVKLKTSMPDAPASSGPHNRAWRDAITQSQQQVLESLEGRAGTQSKSSKSKIGFPPSYFTIQSNTLQPILSGID